MYERWNYISHTVRKSSNTIIKQSFRVTQTLDWIEQGLTSHSRHLGHFGDGGVTAASARIVAAVRQSVRHENQRTLGREHMK